jgi:hypothetical protein
VSQFTSGEQVLADARLRVERFERLELPYAGLVLEGSDDKKLFHGICCKPEQLIVAGGKSLVTHAHECMRPDDRDRFVFLVDDDGDVEADRLHACPDLLVTAHADVETDLLDLGALEPAVAQLVTQGSPADIARDLYADARTLAEPVGRVRRAARRRGIALEGRHTKKWWWDINFTAVVKPPASSDKLALEEVVRVTTLTRPQVLRISATLSEIPSGVHLCNGHDLVAAVQELLTRNHRLSKADVRRLDALLRMTMLEPERRENWSVVKELRAWEGAHGRVILKK